jgi:hypothetical protein
MMRTQGQPTVHGYNAQAAVAYGQIIVAAEIEVESPDFGHLEPIVRAALHRLGKAGVAQQPETVLADAGYWHKKQMENIVSDGIQVLVPPDGGLREDVRPGPDKGMYSFMRRVLASDYGGELYKRDQTGRLPSFARRPRRNAAPHRALCLKGLGSGERVHAARPAGRRRARRRRDESGVSGRAVAVGR